MTSDLSGLETHGFQCSPTQVSCCGGVCQSIDETGEGGAMLLHTVDSGCSLTYPLALGCQWGAQRPENAGTKYTLPVSSTSLAYSSENGVGDGR